MNPQHIFLIEPRNTETLYPFNILHPTFELRCGAMRLFEKVQHLFPNADMYAFGRPLHLAAFQERFPNILTPISTQPDSISFSGDILILKANLLLTPHLRTILTAELQTLLQTSNFNSSYPILFTINGEPFAAYCFGNTLNNQVIATIHNAEIHSAEDFFAEKIFANAIHKEISEARIIKYLWDAINYSAEAIQNDAEFFTMNGNERLRDVQGVFAMNPENISIGEKSDIQPLVVIDARKGAVIIGANVEIQSHTTIVGPCYIGDNAVIKANTRIYEGTALGEYSKVAGELKNTIFQSFGNKQHEGCLGYSFIGEWVNLGAGTDVSDLKNNYSTIRVRFSPDKAHEINTGTTSLGLLAGDHTKSAINTSFNTGTVTGIAANVFDGKPDKYVASFSWGGAVNSPMFEEEKAINLARIVMLRRKRILPFAEEQLLREEFRRTVHDEA